MWLIGVAAQARNRLINLESLTEEKINTVREELIDVARADERR